MHMSALARRTVLAWLAALPAAAALSSCKDKPPPDLGPDMVLPVPPAMPLDPLGKPDRARAREALERAIRWLVRSQDDDGAFRGRVYPVLSSGQSLTPLALWTLLNLPSELREKHELSLAAAQGWLLEAQQPSGALGFRSKVPDYPCYATAYALRCTARLQPERWQGASEDMAHWLEEQQFKEAAGWAGHPAEGGWGMGTREALRPPESGHVDLSMTRCAIEALRDLGRPADGAVLAAARAFVLRSMVATGGFFYSPVLPRLNKGTEGEDGPGAYGSATCDGLLALAALGYRAHHPVFLKSLHFLHAIHVAHENPGIDPGAHRALAEGMKGYYRAGAATVFQRFSGPKGWRLGLLDAVVSEQRNGGYWLNKNRLLNEDEPLVATLLAIQALGGVLRADERASSKAAAKPGDGGPP